MLHYTMFTLQDTCSTCYITILTKNTCIFDSNLPQAGQFVCISQHQRCLIQQFNNLQIWQQHRETN